MPGRPEASAPASRWTSGNGFAAFRASRSSGVFSHWIRSCRSVARPSAQLEVVGHHEIGRAVTCPSAPPSSARFTRIDVGHSYPSVKRVWSALTATASRPPHQRRRRPHAAPGGEQVTPAAFDRAHPVPARVPSPSRATGIGPARTGCCPACPIRASSERTSAAGCSAARRTMVPDGRFTVADPISSGTSRPVGFRAGCACRRRRPPRLVRMHVVGRRDRHDVDVRRGDHFVERPRDAACGRLTLCRAALARVRCSSPPP